MWLFTFTLTFVTALGMMFLHSISTSVFHFFCCVIFHFLLSNKYSSPAVFKAAVASNDHTLLSLVDGDSLCYMVNFMCYMVLLHIWGNFSCRYWFCAFIPSLNSVKLNLPQLILGIDSVFLSACISEQEEVDVCINEDSAVYQHGVQFSEHLGRGLADNWSQVGIYWFHAFNWCTPT